MSRPPALAAARRPHAPPAPRHALPRARRPWRGARARKHPLAAHLTPPAACHMRTATRPPPHSITPPARPCRMRRERVASRPWSLDPVHSICTCLAAPQRKSPKRASHRSRAANADGDGAANDKAQPKLLSRMPPGASHHPRRTEPTELLLPSRLRCFRPTRSVEAPVLDGRW